MKVQRKNISKWGKKKKNTKHHVVDLVSQEGLEKSDDKG